MIPSSNSAYYIFPGTNIKKLILLWCNCCEIMARFWCMTWEALSVFKWTYYQLLVRTRSLSSWWCNLILFLICVALLIEDVLFIADISFYVLLYSTQIRGQFHKILWFGNLMSYKYGNILTMCIIQEDYVSYGQKAATLEENFTQQYPAVGYCINQYGPVTANL